MGAMNDEAVAALGRARLSGAELDAVVSRALGVPHTVTGFQVSALPVNAICTEAVLHLSGTARAGTADRPWDLLVKILRSARHWPLLGMVPEPLRSTFVDEYPWRAEADMRAAGAAERMPDGLRLPVLYRCDDLGDDRVALWTEWIDAVPGGWDAARYRSAALLLARTTARWRTLPISTGPRSGRGTQLREIVTGPIMHMVVPRASDPRLAEHPMFAGADAASLFTDLTRLAGRLTGLVDHFESMPRSIGHGDACPQNLLVSADDPDELVAIDLSWPHPEAIGYDLSQLLIGHAHSGELGVDALPALHETILDGFVEGLRRESCDVPVEDVRFAFDTALVVRSAFQSLPLERLDEPVTPELAAFAARRVELTRYLVDLGMAIRLPGSVR